MSSRDVVVSAREDDELIRYRLLTRMTVTRGEPPQKKLFRRYQAFLNEVLSTPGAEKEADSVAQAEKLARACLQELWLFDFSLRKTRAVVSSNRREQETFRRLLEEAAEASKQAVEDTASLKLELEEAKKERANREEAEAVRARVAEHPSRAQTEQEIAALHAEIALLQSQGAAATRSLETRKKQFLHLSLVVEELQASLGHSVDDDQVVISTEDLGSAQEAIDAMVIDGN